MEAYKRGGLIAAGACLATLAWVGIAATPTTDADMLEEPQWAQPLNLEPCLTEDSDNCYWDASSRSNGVGSDFYVVEEQVIYVDHDGSEVEADGGDESPEQSTEPEPEPEPDGYDEFVEDWRDAIYNDWRVEGYPGRALLEWEEGTLECGINAKPAVDQDGYGNWWAYCEPALVD